MVGKVGWSAEISEAVLCLLRDSVNASVCNCLELGELKECKRALSPRNAIGGGEGERGEEARTRENGSERRGSEVGSKLGKQKSVRGGWNM